MNRCLLILSLVVMLAACQSEPNNAFDADENLVNIHDAQLTKDTVALMDFLDHEKAGYRARAAILSGSIFSEKSRQQLEQLLTDPSWKVRKAAAYALGQYGKKTSIQPLKSALEKEKNMSAKAAMLEAFGKCGDVRHLSYLSDFKVKNDTAIKGWAYGMYRLGVFSVKSIEKAIGYFNQVQMPAAHKALAFYLGDTRTADYRTMQSFHQTLQSLFTQTKDPIIRNYLIVAQQSITLDKKLEFLQKAYHSSSSPVVRYRCIQQLCFTPSGEFLKGIARQFVSDSNLHIRLNVMDWLASKADSSDIGYFRKALQVEGNELLMVKLFKGWLNATNGSREVVKAMLANGMKFENIQARADLFTLLTNYADRYTDNLLLIAHKTKHPVVAYRIVDALKSYYKKHPVPDSTRQSIAVRSVFMMKSNRDPAMTYGAELLADTNIKAYKQIEQTNWLEEMIQQETKPRVEFALSRTLKVIKGKMPTGLPYYLAPHAKPDWKAIKELPARPVIEFNTTKGKIEMALFLENAPMSVWRFYELCQSGYYDTSAVHRVVFPHVIQGGSQFNDGYADDLNPIMTETTLQHYDQGGLIGFASDGRDTETGQYFITHLPRPHLDQNFTIFGKVTKGMEVVNAIQKGDMVLTATIKEPQ